mgnify:CR=1 FL=1
MAGVEGQVTAILTDENLLLERSDGKGMRFELDSIARIRNHHVAVTPPLLTLFGVLSLLASIRVFSGQIQIYSFILGVSSLLVWFLGRKPALCLDTKQGDRHILHGRDNLLQRMYIILDRMSDGCPLEDAVIGLEDFQTLELAPIGDIDDIRHEEESVAAVEAQLNISNEQEQSLEQALEELHRNKNKNAFSFDQTNPPARTPQPSSSSAYERVWGRGEPEWYSEKETQTKQTGMFERSTKALSEQRETAKVETTNYDKPFQLPSFDNLHSNESESSMNRAQVAIQEASDAAFDVGGGMFDIFDQLDNDPSPPQQQAISPATSPPPLQSHSLQSATQPILRPSESRASSYSMIASAAGPNLPEPTRVALRTDIHTSPGLVASATVSNTSENAKALPKKLGDTFTRVTKPDPLAGYPALSKMQKKYAQESRLRVNSSSLKRRSRTHKVIEQWVKPSLKRIDETRRQIGRKLTGAGDGYRDVYGDMDGNQDDSFIDENFQTSQIIRLRADQDSQSDVQERLQLLTVNGGGQIAEDLANRTLRGISNGTESTPISLSGKSTKKLDAPNSFSGMVASTEPAPRFAGMRRLG